jgi:hypothetical protein
LRQISCLGQCSVHTKDKFDRTCASKIAWRRQQSGVELLDAIHIISRLSNRLKIASIRIRRGAILAGKNKFFSPATRAAFLDLMRLNLMLLNLMRSELMRSA